MPGVYLWLDWGFSIALTVCELKANFFVSSQYVYKFNCFPVMIYWIHLSNAVSTCSGLACYSRIKALNLAVKLI